MYQNGPEPTAGEPEIEGFRPLLALHEQASSNAMAIHGANPTFLMPPYT